MGDNKVIRIAALCTVTALLVACAAQKKLASIEAAQMNATLTLPADRGYASESHFNVDTLQVAPPSDTITVNIDGHEMLIMKAVRDDETGEMVATQELRAAVVQARFRNVAERHGKVDLEFQVIVPQEMQDSRWQLRFRPEMRVLGDTLHLDDVIITGADYRRAQLRGYQQYERFLSRIVQDTTKFIDMKNLEIFIERNIPELYAFKTDSTYVSDEEFVSAFGVSERMAVEHYTNHMAKNLNARRKARMDKMWRKYVKSPIVTEHVRLDTVIRALNGDFIYNYIQTINTRPSLRKVDVTLSGDIYEQDRRIYIIPQSDPLTFYISSLSSFVDNRERYLTRVIERRAEANAAWNIDFRVGKSDVDEAFSRNAEEIANIKMNLRSLVLNDTFDLDSITIAASASPEGSLSANNALSARRAAACADYFGEYTRHLQDSLRREAGLVMSVGDTGEESGMKDAYTAADIKFMSRSAGENWPLLDLLVEADSVMTGAEKEKYYSYASVRDVDLRERSMQKEPFYRRMKAEIYPRLRTVQFQFALHRKGMVKDTVHTTELDSTYMRGVQALRDHDYTAAVTLLAPYGDFNAAVAMVSADRNLSAFNLLKDMPKSAPVNYMLAVLYGRFGDEQNAVQHYLTACSQEPAYVHRGNLDPEIAHLIKKYNLNARPDDDQGM